MIRSQASRMRWLQGLAGAFSGAALGLLAWELWEESWLRDYLHRWHEVNVSLGASAAVGAILGGVAAFLTGRNSLSARSQGFFIGIGGGMIAEFLTAASLATALSPNDVFEEKTTASLFVFFFLFTFPAGLLLGAAVGLAAGMALERRMASTDHERHG